MFLVVKLQDFFDPPQILLVPQLWVWIVDAQLVMQSKDAATHCQDYSCVPRRPCSVSASRKPSRTYKMWHSNQATLRMPKAWAKRNVDLPHMQN
jgi:hypothetical protein